MTIQECTRLRVLPAGSGLARQTAFVNLEVDCGYKPNIGRYTVAGRERNNVSWDELVRKEMKRLAVAVRCR